MKLPKISQNELEYNNYMDKCGILEAEIYDKQQSLVFYKIKLAELESTVAQEISARMSIIESFESTTDEIIENNEEAIIE